ncbi:nucleoside-diphosphate-sugar epimerase [Rhizobium leguminosarum]|nr:nucleoside-diphosphate-sugar epimerase [Rhizobium leguminosarum]
MIVPARDGTLRVLRAASHAGVRRVVLTSSFAAVGYGPEAPAMSLLRTTGRRSMHQTNHTSCRKPSRSVPHGISSRTAEPRS